MKTPQHTDGLDMVIGHLTESWGTMAIDGPQDRAKLVGRLFCAAGESMIRWVEGERDRGTDEVDIVMAMSDAFGYFLAASTKNNLVEGSEGLYFKTLTDNAADIATSNWLASKSLYKNMAEAVRAALKSGDREQLKAAINTVMDKMKATG